MGVQARELGGKGSAGTMRSLIHPARDATVTSVPVWSHVPPSDPWTTGNSKWPDLHGSSGLPRCNLPKGQERVRGRPLPKLSTQHLPCHQLFLTQSQEDGNATPPLYGKSVRETENVLKTNTLSTEAEEERSSRDAEEKHCGGRQDGRRHMRKDKRTSPGHTLTESRGA